VDSICDDLVRLDTTVPLIAMTYYNIVLHYGLERSAGKFSSSGITRSDHPDLAWKRRAVDRRCDSSDVATVATRRALNASNASRGSRRSPKDFAYARRACRYPGRAEGAARAERVVRYKSDVTVDAPALIGSASATADQAKQAADVSDGVIGARRWFR